MKKFYVPAAFTLFLCLTLFGISCSNSIAQTDYQSDGEVSFFVPSAVFYRAAELSELSEHSDLDEEKKVDFEDYKIEVKLFYDSAEETQTAQFAGEDLSLTFSDIPVGAAAYATARLYIVHKVEEIPQEALEQMTEEQIQYIKEFQEKPEWTIASGKSETITIKEGDNLLKIQLGMEYDEDKPEDKEIEEHEKKHDENPEYNPEEKHEEKPEEKHEEKEENPEEHPENQEELPKEKINADGVIELHITSRYVLAKNTAESSQKFYLNTGSFVFSLLDQNGHNLLADVDWTNTNNSSLIKKFVDVKYKGRSVVNSFDRINNEIAVSNTNPLAKGGIYQITITVSPLATSYINTSNETVEFPSFEPLTGTFEIEIEDKNYFEVNMTGVLDDTSVVENKLSTAFGTVIADNNAYIKLYGEAEADYTKIFQKLNAKINNTGHLYEVDCSGLTTTGDKAVNECAMQGCNSLYTLILPDDLDDLGYCAFKSCSKLKSVTFGSQLTRISGGSEQFDGCSSLTTVIFPENSALEWIGQKTFNYCSKLETLKLPKDIKYIRAGAFYGSALKEFTFADDSGVWYYTSNGTTLENWVNETETPPDTAKVSDMANINGTYVFADHEITSVGQKMAACAKCYTYTSNNVGPASVEIHLYRVTE